MKAYKQEGAYGSYLIFILHSHGWYTAGSDSQNGYLGRSEQRKPSDQHFTCLCQKQLILAWQNVWKK